MGIRFPQPQQITTNMGDKGHFLISVAKSALRILACLLTIFQKDVMYLAVGFGIAEVLGILEEVVDKRK